MRPNLLAAEQHPAVVKPGPTQYNHGGFMSYRPDTPRPIRDRRTELELADQARAEKRKQDDAQIDSGAEKWRYRPATPATKTP